MKLKEMTKAEIDEDYKRRTELREQKKLEEEKTNALALYISLAIISIPFIYCIFTIFGNISMVEILEIIPFAIVFLPIVFLIGSILHKTFYTGAIYKNVDKKPKKTWL